MSNLPLQRALELAPERSVIGKTRPEQEFFCFTLGNLELGVASENVREVLSPGALTPLPRAPSFLLGVMGHRGEVLPVIDLLRLMGKGEGRMTGRTRLFVGVTEGVVAGVITDSVVGLRSWPLAEIAPPPLGGEGIAEHVLGVVTVGPQNPNVTLLNLPKVLQSARSRARGR